MNPHPRREKQAIKNQSTCWNAAILGRARGGRCSTAPTAARSILGVSNSGMGDPAGDALAEKKVRLELHWEQGTPPRGTPSPSCRAAVGAEGGWQQELAEFPGSGWGCCVPEPRREGNRPQPWPRAGGAGSGLRYSLQGEARGGHRGNLGQEEEHGGLGVEAGSAWARWLLLEPQGGSLGKKVPY